MLNETHLSKLRIMRVGLLAALLTILLGFGIGGVFGGLSQELKSYLKSRAESVLDQKYSGKIENARSALEKASTYIKRAHLHAAGLGTSAIVLMLLLCFLPVSPRWLFLTSLSNGLGALGYSIYWLLGGFLTPTLGSSEVAKETLGFLAIPSAGLCIIGLVLTLWFCIKALFVNPQAD